MVQIGWDKIIGGTIIAIIVVFLIFTLGGWDLKGLISNFADNRLEELGRSRETTEVPRYKLEQEINDVDEHLKKFFDGLDKEYDQTYGIDRKKRCVFYFDWDGKILKKITQISFYKQSNKIIGEISYLIRGMGQTYIHNFENINQVFFLNASREEFVRIVEGRRKCNQENLKALVGDIRYLFFYASFRDDGESFIGRDGANTFVFKNNYEKSDHNLDYDKDIPLNIYLRNGNIQPIKTIQRGWRQDKKFKINIENIYIQENTIGFITESENDMFCLNWHNVNTWSDSIRFANKCQ